ncbi:unnamed protein product [Danaus chrysippus]|uniref:(African queen) hypothetical protein n=1 Tax=Danaus chrysippus TaxID=151541 RepID=A0A8J2QH73_9NEOP|nr:unnamed protein product [Danaus chrysippus]
MSPTKDFAFTNPGLTPDEELSRRGYSMYQASDDDLESGRGTERQTDRQSNEQNGQDQRHANGKFVDELTRELDSRQHKQQQQAPAFLLTSIQNSKLRRDRERNGRESETNPNFIY